jgi:hypothetical protein
MCASCPATLRGRKSSKFAESTWKLFNAWRFEGNFLVAKVILVGADVALLEGLAQTLLGFGHDVLFSATIGEVAGALNEDDPAIAVVSSEALQDEGLGTTLPITPGGAIIVYGKSHADKPFLPTKLQRATLAHLVLPLERQRLLALVQSFDTRSRTTMRSRREEIGEDFHRDF